MRRFPYETEMNKLIGILACMAVALALATACTHSGSGSQAPVDEARRAATYHAAEHHDGVVQTAVDKFRRGVGQLYRSGHFKDIYHVVVESAFESVTQGITHLNSECDIPTIFGVLTVDTEQDALDRAGGSLGNKGAEAAQTAPSEFCQSASPGWSAPASSITYCCSTLSPAGVSSRGGFRPRALCQGAERLRQHSAWNRFR